jgi:hypothetical protein
MPIPRFKEVGHQMQKPLLKDAGNQKSIQRQFDNIRWD